MDNWNKEGFFSGITEDFSNYTWYKGEPENPYKKDLARPLAAAFWDYEREFHFAFLDRMDSELDLAKEYTIWKEQLLNDHLPGKSPNPHGDTTDWEKAFKTGKKE